MITFETVKNELEDIKYYYARRDMFDKASGEIGKNDIVKTVEKYNAIICSAPPKIYELYVFIYTEGCTYEAAAEALCYSVNYVYRTNKKIIEFFYNALNREEAA